jgi:tight adherence protein C
MSLFAFMTFQGTTVGAAAVVVVIALSTGATGYALLAMIAGALVLALIPPYWLRIRVASRRNALLKALPDAVDLIVTSVEAGLAIDAALARDARRGPCEEPWLAVRETTWVAAAGTLSSGSSTGRRCRRSTFIQSIIQAEQTGTPSVIPRTQAAQVRLRKRQRAEADAQRAPVKMVVILVLLVLPATICS